jgi:hypothetical protein
MNRSSDTWTDRYGRSASSQSTPCSLFSHGLFFVSQAGGCYGTTGDYTNFDTGRSDLVLTRILTNHENSIRAAQIVQTISSLLTIPVTSAICSMAFVAFLQASNLRLRLNLRQTMALADQGWISPRIWITISEVGSLPFYIAFALTLFGKSCTRPDRDYMLTCIQVASFRSYNSLLFRFTPHKPHLGVGIGPRH